MSSLPDPKHSSKVGADNSSVDFLLEECKKLPDNNDIVASRMSTARATTGTYKEITEDNEVHLRVSMVRLDFGTYVSETLKRDEVLTPDGYDFLLKEFVAEKLRSGDTLYSRLTDSELEKLYECLTTQKDLYLGAFSDLVYDLSSSVPLTPLEGMHSFTSIPSNEEEAYQCYKLFYESPTFAELLRDKSEEGILLSFKVVRAYSGVNETPESIEAIKKLESALLGTAL